MIDFYLQRSVGIDIRDEFVTVTYLGKGLRGYTRFDQTALKGGILDPVEADGLNGVLRGLREFFQANRISGEEVSVGIPRSQVFLKSIRIPAPERSMIPNILRYEMDRHLPLPVEETYFDYEIAGGEKNLFSVQLAAVRKTQLNRYLDRLASIGIHPSSVDVSTFANRNAVTFGAEPARRKKESPGKTNHLFVDVSPPHLEIDFFMGGDIAYSRSAEISDSPSGFDPFPEEGSGNGEVPSGRTGTDASRRMAEGRKVADRVLAEIRNLQAALGDSALQDGETDIVLAGGETILPIVRETVELESGLKTVPLNLSERIRADGKSAPPLSRFSTSVGLALKPLDSRFRGSNLLPKERRVKKTHVSPYVFLALGGLGLVLAVVYSSASYFQVRNDYREIRRTLETLKPHIEKVEALHLEMSTQAAYLEELSRVSRKNTRVMKILDELTRLTPGEAYLSEIQVGPDQIDIRGLAKNASSLIAPLELSPLFMDVRFDGTIRKSGDLEVFRIRMRRQTP